MTYLDPQPLLALFGGPDHDTAEALGVSVRTILRWRAGDATILLRDADRYAVAAGVTPYELWPELVDRAIDEVQKSCARCGRPFLPYRHFQLYCRPACNIAARIEARPKAKPTDRHCAHCGGVFVSTRASHRFCSKRCSRAAHYVEHKDEVRAYQQAYNAEVRARRSSKEAA